MTATASPIAAPPLPQYTIADWELWEGNWELIEGIPFAMSPLPIPKHQLVASLLNIEFGIALRPFRRRFLVSHPLDYKLSENTVIEPDLLILDRMPTKKHLDFPPRLVVEIHSPSSEERDRGYKFQRYQEQGIPYYLMVDVDAETVEVFELRDGEYALAREGHAFEHLFSFADDCEVTIDFAEIW